MLQVSSLISFTIKHLAILSKLIYCITTCITNNAIARIWRVTVPTSPTTTSLRFASWNSVTFCIIWVFQVHAFIFILMLFKWSRFSILYHSVIQIRTSSTTRWEVVMTSPANKTTDHDRYAYSLWIVDSQIGCSLRINLCDMTLWYYVFEFCYDVSRVPTR
jgi:hypothetical protein